MGGGVPELSGPPLPTREALGRQPGVRADALQWGSWAGDTIERVELRGGRGVLSVAGGVEVEVDLEGWVLGAR